MVEKRIKCVIAEDHRKLNELYFSMLDYEDDIEVVGAAYNGRQVLEIVHRVSPDVILMDIEMEKKNDGIEICRKVLAVNPDIKVVMVTCHDEQDMILAAYEAGAVDYVLKTDSSSVILESVRAAYNNTSPIRPEIAKTIRSELQYMNSLKGRFLAIAQVLSMLTVSEKEVLKLLVEGKKQNEIASIRCVEVTTVKAQVNSILKKFNMKRSQEVIRLVKQMRLSDAIDYSRN